MLLMTLVVCVSAILLAGMYSIPRGGRGGVDICTSADWDRAFGTCREEDAGLDGKVDGQDASGSDSPHTQDYGSRRSQILERLKGHEVVLEELPMHILRALENHYR